jgi:hypothetical protein
MRIGDNASGTVITTTPLINGNSYTPAKWDSSVASTIGWYTTPYTYTRIHLTLEEANELAALLKKAPKLLAKIAPAIEVEFPSK